MALEVGSVFARLSAKLDHTEFARFDRELETRRRTSTVEAKLGARLDPAGFDAANRKIEEYQRLAERRTELKVAFPDASARQVAAAARAYEKELASVETTTGRVDRSSRSLGDGWAYARERIGPLRLGVSGLVGALIGGGGFGLFEAFKSVNDRMQEQQVTNAKLEAGLKATHDASHETAKGLDELATSIQRKTGIDAEQIKAGEQTLLMFRGVRDELGASNNVYDRAIQAATDLSERTGRGLQPTMIALGKALNDPAKGLGLLARYGIQVDEGTKAQIKSLTEHGRTLSAQKIILDQVNRSVAGSAAAYGITLPGAISKAKLALLDMGTSILSKVAPSLASGANDVAKFVTQMETGKGAGGRFKDTVVQIGGAIWSVLEPIGKFVGQVVSFVAKHKDLRDMVGTFLAVSVAIKAISFASQITGVSKLLGLLKTLGATNAGATAAAEIEGAVGGVPGKLERDGALSSRWSKLGSMLGGKLGLAAVAAIGLDLLHTGLDNLTRNLGLAGDPAYKPGTPPGDATTFAEEIIGPASQRGMSFPATGRRNQAGQPSLTRTDITEWLKQYGNTPLGRQAQQLAPDVMKDFPHMQAGDIDKSREALAKLMQQEHASRDSSKQLGDQQARTSAQFKNASGPMTVYSHGVSFVADAHHAATTRTAALETAIETLRLRLSRLTPDTAEYNRTAQLLAQRQRDIHGPTVELARNVQALKDRLRELTPGTAAYNSVAADLHTKQTVLNAAIRDAKPATDHAAGGVKNLRGSFSNFLSTVINVGQNVADETNKLLKQFGAKPLTFALKTVGQVAGGGSSPIAGFERGGYLGTKGARSEDNRLVMAADGEFFMTHHQQPYAELGLALAKMMGFSPFGSLDELASGVRVPHSQFERGGRVQRFASGGSVTGGAGAMIAEANQITAGHYPYKWGGGHDANFTAPYDCSGAVSAVLHSAGLLNAPLVSGQLAGWGLPGPGAVSIFANPQHAYMSILGRFFGTSTSNPGGGAGWYNGSAMPGFAVRHAPTSGDLNIGAQVSGQGPLRAIAQGVANKLGGAASRYVMKQFANQGQVGGGDWGQYTGGAGALSLQQLAALWVQAGGSPGVAQLMAHVAMAESSGNPNAHNASGATGLWQILGAVVPGNLYDPLVNARNAVAKYEAGGLGPWAASQAGWGRYTSASVGFQRGGRLGRLLQRFQSGGRVGPDAKTSSAPLGMDPQAINTSGLDSGIAKAQKTIQRLQAEYDVANRRAGMLDISQVVIPGDPTANPPQPPSLNQQVWNKHETDLKTLLKFRQRIDQVTRNEHRYIGQEQGIYQRAKRRLEQMIAVIKRQIGKLGKSKAADKSRGQLRQRLGSYESTLNTVKGKLSGLGDQFFSTGIDVQNVDLDVQEAGNEITAWNPTALLAPDMSSYDQALSSATTAGGAAGTSPDTQALLDQANQQITNLQATVKSQGAALSVFSGPPDIGTGGAANAFGAAFAPPAGVAGASGAWGASDVTAAAAPTINIYTLHPGDPQTLQAIASASNAGNQISRSIPSSAIPSRV